MVETDAYTLQNIFDVKENDLTDEMLDFSGLNSEQRISKWRRNVEYSMKDRLKYISKVQTNNKRKRLKILKMCEGNVEMQNRMKDRFKKNPVMFFNLMLWTYNPRLQQSHLPFITYPYQDKFIKDIIKAVEEGVDVWVEKSRDMGFSWLMLGIFVRGFLFHNWSALIGSYKESYVDDQGNMDSAFERIRYILSRLPSWLKTKDIQNKFMTIYSKEGGEHEILGDCGVNFGTGGRKKVVFLDEFALWNNDAIALRKTKDVTNCRIFGGTPEGTGNVYGKVMTDHKTYKHLLCKKIRLLWKDHPLKTSVWYQYEIATRTPLDLAKEIDISYETSVTGAVYPLFNRMATKGTYVYDVRRRTYGAWDFGRDMIAFGVFQKDYVSGHSYLIKSFQRKNRHIKDFAGLVKGKPYTGNNYVYSQEDMEIMEYMKNIRFHDHIGDPYNKDSRTVVSNESISTSLAAEGIYLLEPKPGQKRTTLKQRITNLQLSLNTLFYDEDNTEWEQAMIQSRYPSIKENQEITKEKLEPIHNDDSHFRTMTEYYFDEVPDVVRSGDDGGCEVNIGLLN